LALCCLALTGCFTMRNNPEYPPDWPSATSERIGECPLIAGSYRNLGEPWLLAGIDCSLPEEPPEPDDLSVCTPWLAPNLDLWREAQSVRLIQPDGDTLQVLLDDAHPGRALTYRRGSDFRCDAEGLHVERGQSVLEGGAMVIGALLLTGGRARVRRTFVRDREGALVMTIRVHVVGMLAAIGFTRSATSYLRWPPVPQGVTRP